MNASSRCPPQRQPIIYSDPQFYTCRYTCFRRVGGAFPIANRKNPSGLVDHRSNVARGTDSRIKGWESKVLICQVTAKRWYHQLKLCDTKRR